MLMMPMAPTADLQDEKKSRFSTLDLFKKVPFAALRELERGTVRKNYTAKESVFSEDDPADFVWLVQEGHVREVHHSVGGGDLTIGMVRENGLFGISAFIGGQRYGYHAVAETDSVLLSFPAPYLQDLMGRCPEMVRAVVSQMSRLLRRSEDMQAHSRESAEKRLLHALVEMTEEFGGNIPMTRKKVAEIAGTAVETCIRVFVGLQEQGLIASSRGKIVVLDMAGLKRRLKAAGL